MLFCAFYSPPTTKCQPQVLPEKSSSGAQVELNPNASFTSLQPFPPNPLCNLPNLVATAHSTSVAAVITGRNDNHSTGASYRAITTSREEELYDPQRHDEEMAEVAHKFAGYDLSPTHGLIFVKFYNPDYYVRAMHGGDGHGEGGFLLPGSGTRSYNERELVFLGSALVRLDAIATQVMPQLCAALLLGREEYGILGGREGFPLLRLVELVKFDDVQSLYKGSLIACELDDGDIICCQKQRDVTTIFMLIDDDEGVLEEAEEERNSDQNSNGFVTLPAPGAIMALPRKVRD